ncbi:MAG: DUF3578 domain-containing protein [Alphaproteobacteria bacterium]|nr:MAG: DUF3578 domain-containing protein [Alphaproteobacteria bacterium]
MTVSSTLDEIVTLQGLHSSLDTPAMKARGQLVRETLKAELSEWRIPIATAFGRYGDDLEVKGSDGTGLKALVPWARLYSRRMSPAPTKGWYLVYLFHPDAAGVSLCLSHGSTTPEDGNFKGISRADAAELVSWAQSVLKNEFGPEENVLNGIKLGKQRLAAAYERTTVFSKFYAANSIPDDEDLVADICQFANALAKLYRAQDAGVVPGSAGAEVVEVLQLAEDMAAPFQQPLRGQGWGLDGPERRAVELRAMKVAEDWLTREGFNFTDVSASDSCDFRARRDGSDWIIEVKGTTGGPKSILVTRNEVALHRASHPLNALLVVHGIKLGKNGAATGGSLLAISPWLLDDNRLEATSYEYRLS